MIWLRRMGSATTSSSSTSTMSMKSEMQLGGDARLDDIAQIVYKLGQVHRAQFERNLAALDTAHIEYIVDEREQMLARRRGLFQVVEHLLTVVDMGGRKRGEADDRVHRRADVVRHIEQKFALGAVCRRFLTDSAFKLGVFLLKRGLIFLFERFLLLEEALFRSSPHEQEQR